MNARRRKVKKELCEQLDSIILSLNELRDKEDEDFNNLPENLQGSERAVKMEEVE